MWFWFACHFEFFYLSVTLTYSQFLLCSHSDFYLQMLYLSANTDNSIFEAKKSYSIDCASPQVHYMHSLTGFWSQHISASLYLSLHWPKPPFFPVHARSKQWITETSYSKLRNSSVGLSRASSGNWSVSAKSEAVSPQSVPGSLEKLA